MKGRYKVTFREDGKVTYEFRTNYRVVAVNTALRHNHGPHWCENGHVTVTDTKTGRTILNQGG